MYVRCQIFIQWYYDTISFTSVNDIIQIAMFSTVSLDSSRMIDHKFSLDPFSVTVSTSCMGGRRHDDSNLFFSEMLKINGLCMSYVGDNSELELLAAILHGFN